MMFRRILEAKLSQKIMLPLVGALIGLEIALVTLTFLTMGCSKTLVIKSDSETVALQKGEKAPFEGFILTEGALTDLLETLERCKNK